MEEYIEKLQVLSLKPTDVLVVKVNGFLTEENVKKISIYIQNSGIKNNVIFIEGGMELQVLRQEDA